LKYIVQMGPVAILYIPSFIKIGSGIQRFVRRYRHTEMTDIA
jgi:hypothetical protein